MQLLRLEKLDLKFVKIFIRFMVCMYDFGITNWLIMTYVRHKSNVNGN